MTNHLTDDELILHSYGEIDRADRARVDEHLSSCEQCQLAKEQLARVMTMIDTASPVEAPDGFERIAWARLEPELEKFPVRRSARWFDLVVGKAAREGGWFPQWALAGGVAALLVVAFWAGRISNVPTNIAGTGNVANVEPERVLQTEFGEHLDRTQMMLVELVNADTDHADVLASEQPRAADLVAANRLMRQSAMQSGDAQIVDILDDLERVLLEIANAPTDASSKQVTDLQSQITNEDLLFRLRVIASEMRQRQMQGREAGDPTRRKMPRS